MHVDSKFLDIPNNLLFIHKELPEQDVIGGAEKEVTIRSFKSYIEFLKFFQKNLSKESMNELLKHNKILLNIYQKYKERTMKQQLYKLR